MTILTVEGQGRNVHRMTVSGHAGFAPSGQDIVCAAVSVLVTTAVNALESVAGVAAKVHQDEDEAVIGLELPSGLKGQTARDAQIILQTVLRGFQDIVEAYPKHLKIIDGRKSSC